MNVSRQPDVEGSSAAAGHARAESATADTRRRRRLIVAAVALLCILVSTVFIYRHQHPAVVAPGLSLFAGVREQSAQVPVLFVSPAFDFVNQDGLRTSSAALGGKIWIADFIFTHCAGQCPIVTGRLVEVQKAIDNPDVRFVSFSVDPDRDDPQTLKQYAQKYNASESRWLLLRPPNQRMVLELAKHMAALARSPDATDTIVHTDSFVLIDGAGRVRGLYDSKDPKLVQRLKTDVEKVARQALLERATTRDAAAATQ